MASITSSTTQSKSKKFDATSVLGDFQPNDPKAAFDFFQKKMTFSTGPVELNSALEKGADIVILDVREKSAYDKGHIPGAISMPRDQWSTFENLEIDKLNVIYCYSEVCHLGARACALFAKEGYPVMEMAGGFQAWEQNGLEAQGADSEAA